MSLLLEKIKKIPATVVVLLVAVYQALFSPIVRYMVVCRYEPSCAEYMKQSIIQFGVLRGGIKGVRRVASCHPFSKRPPYDPPC